MKKKALILGNMDPILGVKNDIENFKAFLKSLRGGAWHETEIDIIQNPSQAYLLKQIESYRKSNYDYFLFLFGGHGDTHQNTTHIFPSHIHDYDISEDVFERIATKQLSIFDCCRVTRKTLSESSTKLSMEHAKFDSAESYLTESEIRKIYHDSLASTVKQSLKLYACSVNEYAQDDNGGLYTQNLIKSAIEASDENVRTASAIYVHNLARPIVVKKSRDEQHPTYKGLLRIPEKQQLVLSINPQRYIHSTN